MIDKFLRNLVYKEWEIRGKKVVFLDLLLLFCTLFFGLLIRRTLGENSLVIMADYVCAFGISAILRIAGGSLRRAYIAFAVMIFQPVFLLNGAMAGGYDSVVCAVALVCMLLFLNQKRKRIFFGILCLISILVVLRSNLNWAGGAEGSSLSYSCPNIYQIIGMEVLPEEYGVAGTFFTLAVIFIAVFCFVKKHMVDITPKKLLKILLFFIMLVTFFMPYTEVSCGVFVTMLAVALGFCEPENFYIPIVTTGCYFACQTYQLTGSTMVPLYVYAFLMLALLTILGVQLYKEMEKKVQMEKKTRPGSGKLVWEVLFFLGITALGLFIRYAFKDVETMDYRTCLKPWVDEFKAVGSFKAIAGDFYNYTPPYMYILYGISRLPMEPLYPIKLVSVFFDFLLAYFSGRIVLELTGSKSKSVLTYGIVFCLPTVAANSGMWAQCDAMYVTCIVASLYFILKDRSHLSMLCYGMAFALKLQSLFVFPLYVFLWVRKKYRIEQFLYIPFMYLVMCVPSALAGKSMRELLMVYVEQGNTEPWMLSWNWPNIYLLFGPTNFYEKYATAGVIGTLAVLMLVLYYMVKKGVKADHVMILKGMLMFALLVPYFLPYMHERYGYLADVLAVILFVVCPSKFYIALTQVLLSYTAYTGYLHGQSTVPQIFYCFVMTVLIIVAVLQVLFPQKRSREAVVK